MSIAAVIFDLGGVVLESPLAVFADYERELGLPIHTLNRGIVAAGAQGAWARLERGEFTLREFFSAFDAENAAQGVTMSTEVLMARVAERTAVRPAVVNAIRRLRANGLKVAALTNNWVSEDQSSKMEVLRSEFDVFIESTRVGLRKPDLRIYELACRELGVEPERVAYLDDIGLNLKPARVLGMTTIKVDDIRKALTELAKAVNLPLLDGDEIESR
jgi:putative hydrolase of the HAD superfamily